MWEYHEEAAGMSGGSWGGRIGKQARAEAKVRGKSWHLFSFSVSYLFPFSVSYLTFNLFTFHRTLQAARGVGVSGGGGGDKRGKLG